MTNTSPRWTPAPAQADEFEINLGEILGILWRRKWAILLVGLICGFLGALFAMSQPRLYSASTTLIHESNQQKSGTGLDDLLGGGSNSDTELNTQIQVMLSRPVVGAVVARLNLIDDPEFVAGLGEPGLIGKAKAAVAALLNSKPTDLAPHDEATIELTKKLNITVVQKTKVVRVGLETRSPQKSVAIVNALSVAYDEYTTTERDKSSKDTTSWIGVKVAELKQNLADAERKAVEYRVNTERAVTAQDVAVSTAALKSARGRLSSYTEKLLNAAGSNLPRTNAEQRRLTQLENDVQEYEQIVAKQTADLLMLQQLDREALAAGTIYQQSVLRLNEIEAQNRQGLSAMRKLSPPILAVVPTKPRIPLTIAIATFFGLTLAVAYALLRGMLDRAFTDPAKLQEAFGIPVVGAIPLAPVRDKPKLLRYVLDRPASGVMEAVRDMRTTVIRSTQSANAASEDGQSKQVILMTSSLPNEGKTTTSMLLALNFAALDKRVLLVECDVRRSTFQSYFGNQRRLGLVDIIAEPELESEVIWRGKTTKIDVIFGGKSGGRNAADIFASQEFASFVDRMRGYYDVIVLDAPPVLPVPDASLIAEQSDIVIYSVKSASTQSSTVAAGLQRLNNVGVEVDGLCLTQLKTGVTYGYGGNKYYQN